MSAPINNDDLLMEGMEPTPGFEGSKEEWEKMLGLDQTFDEEPDAD